MLYDFWNHYIIEKEFSYMENKRLNKNTKKIGLITSISMLIGSIIGVGIFFKNGGIFEINNSNAISILISWILAAIISLFTALSFAEVGSSVQSKSGLGGWIAVLFNERFGKFIKIIQPGFYLTAIAYVIAMFGAEAIFNIFNLGNKIHVGYVLFVGFILFLYFLIFNFISLKASGRFQVVATTLKFVPIFLVIFWGFIYGGQTNANSLLTSSHLASDAGSVKFVPILTSIPSILFAFDSFTGVGSLSKDLKNPRKNVPLTIVIGLITVMIFYLLITVSQLFTGSGNVYKMFSDVILKNSSEVLKTSVQTILSVFIMVCIIGVLNSFCAVLLRAFEGASDEQIILGHRQIKKLAYAIKKPIGYKLNRYNKFIRDSENLCGFIYGLIFFTIMWLIIAIPSLVFNTDAFVDGFSNFPTTVFFGVYGIAVLGALINRKTNKVEVQKIKGFLVFGPIATIGCLFVFAFQVFYAYTFASIGNANDIIAWGLFFDGGFKAKQWHLTMLFACYMISIIVFYSVNIWYIKRNDLFNDKLAPNYCVDTNMKGK